MSTVFCNFCNNAITTLAAPYTVGSGVLVLNTGFGSLYGSTFPIRVTLITRDTYGSTGEAQTIYQVTGRSGDVLTGVSATEGTVDRNYAVGDIVEMRFTAGEANLFSSSINALEVGASGTVTSVGFRGDGTVLSNTLSGPVTTSGTLNASLSTQAPNRFLAGPLSGSTNLAPTFRPIIPADMPVTVVQTTNSYSQPPWITSISGSIVSGNIPGNAVSIIGSIAESQVTNLPTDLAAKAPLASPIFTGTVTLPTSLTGLLKASTGVVSTATPGTDYLAPGGSG